MAYESDHTEQIPRLLALHCTVDRHSYVQAERGVTFKQRLSAACAFCLERLHRQGPRLYRQIGRGRG